MQLLWATFVPYSNAYIDAHKLRLRNRPKIGLLNMVINIQFQKYLLCLPFSASGNRLVSRD